MKPKQRSRRPLRKRSTFKRSKYVRRDIPWMNWGVATNPMIAKQRGEMRAFAREQRFRQYRAQRGR